MPVMKQKQIPPSPPLFQSGETPTLKKGGANPKNLWPGTRRGTGFCLQDGENITKHRRTAGFTLVEMAVVLLIMALLLGGLLPTLSSRVEQQRLGEVRKQLDEIEQAAIGYALINGRLPCPASSSSNGAESFASGGNATNGNCSITIMAMRLRRRWGWSRQTAMQN